jgi:hypothetical protein
METKTVVIIGSVVLLGVGAFIYFKPKAIPTAGVGTSNTGTSNTGTSNTGTSNTGTSNTSTSSSGTLSAGTSSSGTTNLPSTETVLTTPQEVIEVAKKMAEAKDLATKISDLRNGKNRYLSLSLLAYATETGMSNYPEARWKEFRDTMIAGIDKQIKDLNEQIGKLGYMEVNGGIVKIV